jgi:hypothetical protein
MINESSNNVHYIEVEYNNKRYIVGDIINSLYKTTFVFDKDKYKYVKEYRWHRTSDKYLSFSLTHEGKKKEMYLHNFIMGNTEFPGKGAKETIDHINRIGFDNRKENLRLITQSQQNMNQIVRARNITLPEGCGIIPEDIPRHIWYIKANGAHGDRFAIEFKTENLCWKTTSSKKKSLKEKLEEAKEKLAELYVEYPYLNPFNTHKIELEESLKDSYNKIIELSLYIQ